MAFVAVEATALAGAGMIAVIAALGRFAAWFVGSGLWRNLLPFAAAVLGLAVAIGVAIRVWLAVRGPLAERWAPAPAAAALVTAIGALWFACQPTFSADVHHLRALIGGQAAAERAAIAHQVYAAYRRADRRIQQRLFERSQAYESVVAEAAALFDLDPALLMGVAATESAFRPRRSADGGRGLFQITVPPDAALRAARAALEIERLDLDNDRHNVYAGAATLRAYLDQMHDDLFLGLLAYNIGPLNGGLVAIMRQYGARDFVTIQPYLQQLPRDYPIRVLSAALAYKLWKAEGRLPKYEEGDNAARIQAGGIPGLES
jgi:soluble lytic murein transglycosylase-like protein